MHKSLAALALLCLLAACGGEPSEGQIMQMARRFHTTAGSATRVQTIELTVPDGFVIASTDGATVTDTKGGSHQPQECQLSTADGAQKLSVRVELPAGAETQTIQVDKYVIDVKEGVIRRAK